MMTPLPEPCRWQGLLDRHSRLFGDLDDGCRIGVARRGDVNTPDATMVVWEAQGGRLVALGKPFPGYRDAGVDVLLVGDEEAICQISGELEGDALPVLKRLVRRGNLVCYVLRRQCELIEAGYEDVMLSLGVAFAGACR